MSTEEGKLIQIKVPGFKRIGITLSFLLESHEKDTMAAQIHLEKLGAAISQWVKTEFPNVKHTLTSRQEYEP